MLEAPEETEHQQLLAQTCLCASHLAKMETERHPGFISHIPQDKAIPAAAWPCCGASPRVRVGSAGRGAGTPRSSTRFCGTPGSAAGWERAEHTRPSLAGAGT